MGKIIWKTVRLTPLGSFVLLVIAIIVAIAMFHRGKAVTPFSCNDLKRTNILRGDKQYFAALDRDRDGIACES